MEDKEKLEVKKIIDLMLEFLFYYSDDLSIRVENEVNQILIYFKTDPLDERVRTNIMRTIKTDTDLIFNHGELIKSLKGLVDDVRMETTDDETKIMLIKSCEI